MIKLTAKIREEVGRKTGALKDDGRIPAVIYGHGIENASLDLDYKEFVKALKDAGESSLIEMHVEGEKEKRLVLVHDLQKDAVSDMYIHVDFFETSAKEEVEVGVALVIEGTSLAVKDLGGTLVQYIHELEIKAMPQDLPHNIVVSIDGLNTFEDRVLVKDLTIPKGVKVLTKPEEIVVSVAPPANVEEDLATEIEEKVEDIEKVEKEKKEEVVVDDGK
ncbi:MAG: 50S ribosomal protein L25 [Candidatus Staskawiczbacteria bacterium]|nr:50S ribosomal protein L25 [Candidatus Staskawiczbacteria bacterium]